MKSRKVYVVVAALCITVVFSIAFSVAASADYQTEEVAVTEVTTIQLSDSDVRRIVRDEYGTYLNHLEVVLIALGILAAVAVVIIPSVQTWKHQKEFNRLSDKVEERTERLNDAINEAEKLKRELDEAKIKTEELQQKLKDAEKEIAIISDKQTEFYNYMNTIDTELPMRYSSIFDDIADRCDNPEDIKKYRNLANQYATIVEVINNCQH